MTVMIAAAWNPLVELLSMRFPNSIGWMVSPAANRFGQLRNLPYAIDNGKFAAWRKNEKWNAESFLELVDKCLRSPFKPRWIVVPDEITNRIGTLKAWTDWSSKLRRLYGLPLAFAAQDGMKPSDVPRDADLVFIGGSTNWKWRNVAHFAAVFPRVHVGRVNWHDKLEYCLRLGIESVDGSGFFRGDQNQKRQLVEFISGRRRYEEQPQFKL